MFLYLNYPSSHFLFALFVHRVHRLHCGTDLQRSRRLGGESHRASDRRGEEGQGDWEQKVEVAQTLTAIFQSPSR